MSNEIVIAILILGVTGLAMGLFLAFASKKFEVEVDERVEKIMGCLPGANCGGCGFPGCGGYADAVVNKGASPNLCAPGGPDLAVQIGEIMGMIVEPPSGDKIVAKVLCQGTHENANLKYNFRGEIQTCAAANLYAGGQKTCQYACLGLGDCVVKCPVNAIVIENGIAKIDYDTCVSCGACVNTCPKKVIEMLPQKKIVTVTCSSKDKGVDAKKGCKVACIGCGMCVKACPKDAIVVENNLAKIIPEKCINCGLCELKCPTFAIINTRHATGHGVRKPPVPPKKPDAPKAPVAPATGEKKVETPKAETPKVEVEEKKVEASKVAEVKVEEKAVEIPKAETKVEETV